MIETGIHPWDPRSGGIMLAGYVEPIASCILCMKLLVPRDLDGDCHYRFCRDVFDKVAAKWGMEAMELARNIGRRPR